MYANMRVSNIWRAPSGAVASPPIYDSTRRPGRQRTKATVARGVGTEGIRQIAPGCSRSPARLRPPRSFTRGTPRAQFGSFGLIATISKRDQGAWHGFGPGAALSSRPVGD